MSSEALQFVFSLFSFVGVVGILFYMIREKSKEEQSEEEKELLEEKVERLEQYLYELEERLDTTPTSSSEEIKKRIIAMYEEGKDLLVIENSLDVPRPKIEMILKFYKLREKERNR
ncbi:MAG: hypothetical protein DSZ11_02115 [Sulfurovum sp.]|nr:MAG: hypothetical protein DSZ11_02115 [Sulfurovum sp.]